MPTLSCIIPLYNCGPYIMRCLDSLLLQNVDMEIIVIDDGSTDNGYDIVVEYASAHKNILLLRQDNHGPSSARNMGLRHATGKYVYFMDADDFIKPDTIRQLVALMEERGAEMARFQTRIIPEEESDSIAQAKTECHKLHVSHEYTGGAYIESTKAMAGVTLWRHIFLRDAITNSGVKFNESLYLEEDYVFLLELLCRTGRVIVCDGDKPHYWVKRLSSSSNTVNIRALRSMRLLIGAYVSLLQKFCLQSKICRDYIYVRIALAMQVYLFAQARRGDLDDIRHSLSYFKKLGIYPFKTRRALTVKGNLMKGNKLKWIIINTQPLLMFVAKFMKR